MRKQWAWNGDQPKPHSYMKINPNVYKYSDFHACIKFSHYY